MSSILSFPPGHFEEVSEPLEVARLEANAFCVAQMSEWMEAGRDALAKLRATLAPYGDGRPIPLEVEADADELRDRAEFCRRHFVIHAVRGMVLSGRLPEEREAEAFRRCDDDEGLTAFLDEMSQVPVGFVDRPTIN